MTCADASHEGPQLRPLPLAQSGPVVSLLSKPHQQLVAKSVIAGNTSGCFWADNASRPDLVVLWDGGHHLYMAAEKTGPESARMLKTFLSKRVMSRMTGSATSRCMISSASTQTEDLLRQVLPDAVPRRRIFLRSTAPPKTTQALRDNTLRLEWIDRHLLEADLCHVDDVRNEVRSMWGSVEAFLRGGVGYCVVDGPQIVCWCTAEYVSPCWCGIGIETIQPYQGRGLATATAAAFVEHCLAHGIIPHWDCWADNAPSVRVARKIGFKTVEEFTVYRTGGAHGSGL